MDKAILLAITLGSGAALLAGCGAAPRREHAPAAEVADGIQAGGDVSVELLEPFDPGRIPVLLVHGIDGSPRDFAPVLAVLDRNRFQAWALRYSTDAGLDAVARGLGRDLRELRRRYGYTRLIIIAHSMGGLVARRYVMNARAGNERDLALALIAFSSPWDGNEWAAVGARFAPHPPASWVDLAPGSRFLTALRDPIPGVRQYVFFGFRRGPSLLTSQSSDGTITVESQIPCWIQDQATRYWGYDADHTGILKDAAALQRLRAVLAHEAGR